MSGAGFGALMSGLSSGYMAGKQIQRWNNDNEAMKTPPVTGANTAPAAKNQPENTPVAVPPPALGTKGIVPGNAPANGAGGTEAGFGQKPALPATATAKAQTDSGSWSTLSGILNPPKA